MASSDKHGMFAVFGAVTLAVTLAGCAPESSIDLGEGRTSASTPSTTSAPVAEPVTDTSTPSTETPESHGLTNEEAQVVAAYRRWWEECMPAANADPENALDHTTGCADERQAQAYADGLVKWQAEGKEVRGKPVVRPNQPEPHELGYLVTDCQNTMDYALYDVDSGERLTTGLEEGPTMSLVLLEDGKWVVASMEEIPERAGEVCT